MKTLLVLSSILLYQAFGVVGQVLHKAKLDSLFKILEEQKKVMGNLSVFQNGKEIYTYNTGYANVAKKLPINSNTKYRIGSVSKMLTATIIMQLVEEGRLSLQSKLSQFYPALPNAGDITLLHLLQHKSGLRNTIQDPTYREWRKNNITRQEMLRKIEMHGATFAAGDKQEYSNTNYILLTFIAEDVEKKTFAKIVETRISKPLKLKNTFFGSLLKEENNEALSYHKREDWLPSEETHFSVAVGAGAVISTPHDLNTFTSALFNGKLLKESSLKQMQEMQGEYGIGLKQMDVQGTGLIGHSGGIDGFKSVAYYAPSTKMAFSFSSNGGDVSVSELLWAISSISLGKEYDLPNFNIRKLHAPEELDKLAGTYQDKSSNFKITVQSKDGIILVQDGPQSKGIVLDAVKKNTFRMGLAGMTLDFLPDEKGLTMVFEGKKLHFNKI